MGRKKVKVLFVDDDATLLQLVGELLGAMAGDGWEILTASDTAGALKLIHAEVVDLLVTDIHMPVVDGIQFLKLLQRKYPNLLKVVLTGDTSGAHRATCLEGGAELYLEKPRSKEGWRVIYATLNELVKFQPEEGFRGVLRKVGLQEIIQLECLATHSSVLEVKAGPTLGTIYIEEGRIVQALCGDRAGEEALYFLLSRSGGEFGLKPFVPPSERPITASWEGLLMEAAQRLDEHGAAPDTVVPGEDTAVLLALAEAGAVGPRVAVSAVPERGATSERQPRTAELLVCSAHGEVLYEWQCANTRARILFLEFLSQKTRLLSQGLPLGFFDRLELREGGERVVIHVAADRALFLRTVYDETESAGKARP